MANEKTSRRGLKLCCGVTAIFLLIIVIVIITLSFTIFKPKDPKISLYPKLQKIDLSSFVHNLTLGTIIAIENPNYGAFTFKNTTSYVHYHGDVVGEAPIEHRFVPARHKLNVTTAVHLMAGKLLNNSHFPSDLVVGSMNLTSTATLPGKVIVLKIFKFHATVYNNCNISVFINPPKIESICETKLKL
ncbi:late embryogenesis abundant protein [Fagus crenata]